MSEDAVRVTDLADAFQRQRRRGGCLRALLAYGAWISMLAVVLLVVLFIRFGPIFAGVSRTMLLPLYMRLLDETHSAHQRVAFSNAFVGLLALVDSNGWTRSAPVVMPPFQELMTSAQDQLITTNESTRFCREASRETHHTADPQ
jgi:hypothetical protein